MENNSLLGSAMFGLLQREVMFCCWIDALKDAVEKVLSISDSEVRVSFDTEIEVEAADRNIRRFFEIDHIDLIVSSKCKKNHIEFINGSCLIFKLKD